MVPNLLLFAVPFYSGRMLLAILPPVVAVAGAPLLRTVQTDLAVFGIAGDLAAVIVNAPMALASRVAANQLPRLILRWLEVSLTVAASPFDHTGGYRTARLPELQDRDLETVVECVPHPRRWLVSFQATEPAEMLSF